MKSMKLFYPDNEVSHPIDRYPILSSSLINQQKLNLLGCKKL